MATEHVTSREVPTWMSVRNRSICSATHFAPPAAVECALATLMAVAASARAQDPAEETPPPPQGLMPVPNYNLDLASRAYLSGDWGGARSTLADKGIQLTVDWNQYLQGVVDGGLDRTTQYGGALDYVVDLDLMRMGVLDGALINIRVESRYGNSVNGQSGSILPVNTDAFFPLTDSLDEDVAFAITDLKYTQFLSPNLAVLLGKADTLSGDPNEFASGRGTTQFMNANFLFNSVTALRMPYSTLAAATSRASRRSTTSPSRRQPMSVSTHNSSSRWRAALTQPFSSACASG